MTDRIPDEPRDFPERTALTESADGSVRRSWLGDEAYSYLATRPHNIRNNSCFEWDKFNSAVYFDHNYRTLRADDRLILERIRDFFAAHSAVEGAAGIDVGSGANLYPTLAMLPFCSTVTLWEYSTANVQWLTSELQNCGSHWQPFWGVLRENARYQAIREPAHEVAERASVVQGSIFELPRARWDMGTLFFVAESLSSEQAEFEQATVRFLRALRPGAPFAAAFMENSIGYMVGDVRYPSVEVDASIIKSTIEAHASALEVGRIEIDNQPLRDGYTGMILACGTVSVRDGGGDL